MDEKLQSIINRQKAVLFVVLFAVITVVVLLLMTLLRMFSKPPVPFENGATVEKPQIETPENTPEDKNTGEDLGSAIYQGASNPVQDKLPETTIPNPIQNVYKNPFE